MQQRFQIKEDSNKLIIELYPEIALIIKIISIIASFFIISLFSYSLTQEIYLIFNYPDVIFDIGFLFSTSLLILYLFAAFYIVKYATRKDVLVINQKEIIFTKKSLLFRKSKNFPLNKIIQIKATNPPQFTEHPLKNTSIDPTGIVANEKGVQFISDQGKIEIITDQKSFFVGPKIPDWDVEIILKNIDEFMQKNNLTKKTNP